MKFKYPTVIGMLGDAGSGKDFCANLFPDVTCLAFADKIREFLEEVDPCVFSYVTINNLLKYNSWDALKKPDFDWPHFLLAKFQREIIVNTVRVLMQTYGEAGRKCFGKNHWIDQILPRHKTLNLRLVDSLEKYSRNIVIKDVRRIDEANRIKELGGFLVRVVDSNIEKREVWRCHITETENKMISEDYTIINTLRSKEHVITQIERIVNDINLKKDRDG